MPRFLVDYRRAVMIAAAAVIVFPIASYAQSSHSGGAEDHEEDTALSDFMTTSTIRNLQSIQTECVRRPSAYQLDCLRQGIELVWRRLPYHGNYGVMRAAIQRSTEAIATVVETDTDKSTPRLDSGLSANPRFQARRFYTAISSERDGSARSAARGILSNLASNLRTKKDDPENWNENYGRVAGQIAEMAGSF